MSVMKLPALCWLSRRLSLDLRARLSARLSALPPGRCRISRLSWYAGPPCRHGGKTVEPITPEAVTGNPFKEGRLPPAAPALDTGRPVGAAALGVLAAVSVVSKARTAAGSRHSPSDSEVLASGELRVAVATSPSPPSISLDCTCRQACTPRQARRGWIKQATPAQCRLARGKQNGKQTWTPASARGAAARSQASTALSSGNFELAAACLSTSRSSAGSPSTASPASCRAPATTFDGQGCARRASRSRATS